MSSKNISQNDFVKVASTRGRKKKIAKLSKERASNCQKPLLTKFSVSLKSKGNSPTHKRSNCIHRKNK